MVTIPKGFVDIHCHLLPSIDDGASSEEEAIRMATAAVDEGISHIIVTPHQLGAYRQNSSAIIREKTSRLQAAIADAGLPLEIRPGADVRIEPDMVQLLQEDEVVTLADQKGYVLLELPHDVYFPLEPLLQQLHAINLVGVLSHPERNRGIQANPAVVHRLVDAGALMQITCGSLTGEFGKTSKQLSERLLENRLVHFVATDAHGTGRRRPAMIDAFDRVTELTDRRTADRLFRENPRQVWENGVVDIKLPIVPQKRSLFGLWRSSKLAAR